MTIGLNHSFNLGLCTYVDIVLRFMIVTAFNTCMFSIVLIEDHMSDWHSCQILSVIGDCSNEFGKVQKSALVKASGCLNSNSTEALEILTNKPPIEI